MALVIANRVQETTTTTGTGTVTLAGAVAGFQSFAVVGNTNTTYYTLTSGTDWEVGIGTYSTTGPTLARTTILSSSIGGGAITLAGTSTVFSSYPAEKVISDGYGLLPIANGGTNATTAGGALTSLGAYPAANPSGFTSNTGTVTSVNLTAGTGVSVSGGPVTTSGAITVTNTAPDQTVALTGAGTTVVTGTYPNFTITSNDSTVGTVTSVNLTAGTGVSVSGGPITSSGAITVTNTAPDQVVALTGAGTTVVSGTYPNFTITSTDSAAGTVTSVGGTGTVNGITLTGTVTTSGSLTLGGTLSGVSLTTQVSGTLPIANGGTNGTSTPIAGAVPYGTGTAYAFTAAGTSGQVLTSAGAGIPTWTTPTTGTVTSVTGTAPVVSSGGATPAISMAAATTSVNGYLTSTDWTTFNNKGSGTVTSVSGTGTVSGLTLSGTVTTSGNLTLGGTLAVTASNFASQTANTFLAAPNGSAGVPTFRAIVAADIPTLNQNTTGTATNLSTDRTNWSTNGTITAVVGQLAWKNYGNNHTIFDASASTAPDGSAVSNTTAQVAWSGTYPTLMGWNGVNTYGVRVDSARVADSAGAVDFNSLTNKTGGTGTYTTSGDFRAPIFYDSNNTAYYVDAASTSVLNELQTFGVSNIYDVSTNHEFGLFFAVGKSTAYAIYREAGAWTHPYPDLRIAFHTGIKMGANAGYGGMKFYTDYDMSSQVMSINNSADGLGGANVFVNNSLQAASSLRAPIFYDSDNTAYYVDPASTSNLYRTNGDGFAASQFLCGMTNYADQVSASTWYGIGRSDVVGWTAGGMVQVAGYTGTRLRGAYSIIDIDGSVGANLINFTTNTARFIGDVRASVFYDVDNTAYYVDPNATSNLLGLTVANTITGSVSGNAATVGGFTPSATAGVANRVVVAHAAGYIFNNYFNSTDNSVASGVTAVMVKAGDDYYRSGTAAAIATFISGQSMNISGSSTTAGNVTGTVAVANGGTGATTLTANNVLLGNGTSAVQAVAPSTSGNLLTSNGTTWVSSALATAIQEFSASGTWTKPTGAKFVMVECWGAGGGGGGGARRAAAIDRTGGGGGGGGAYTYRLFSASSLGATETVTIGAGGTAGAARTVDGGSQSGGNGGNTSFGSQLFSYGGGGSSGLQGGDGGGVLSAAISNTTAGEPEGGQFGGSESTLTPSSGFGGASGASHSSSTTPTAAGCSYQGGGGGGGAGGISAANVAQAGGIGGFNIGATGGGGAGGATAGSGNAGAAGTVLQKGGGGGASGTAAIAGGTGGAGGPAAGGGGGGASTTGANSGAGGLGGAGFCRVYTW